MKYRLTLIYPAHKKNLGDNRKKGRYPIPQLSLPSIAGLTDNRFEITIVDDNIEDINFDAKPDLVGITTMTALAPRAYEIAQEFRKRGVPVILGGIHVSMLPEEAANYADSIVLGEAEDVWPVVLEDFIHSRLKKIYKGTGQHTLVNLPRPRLDLLKRDRYFSSSLLMASRGCPHDCHYCSVTTFWGKGFRYRPIPEVIEELKSLKGRMVFFADDNLYGNKVYAKKLFREMVPLKKKWSCQGDSLIANDKELLNLAAESGCQWIFIGIESISEKNLAKMRKSFNKVKQYKESFKKIHDAGINIFGSFIFGLDEDDKNVFKETVDFAIDAKLDAANFYILTPLPGTKLFQEMKDEGRLLHTEWDKYDANHVVFKHPKLTSEELLSGLIFAYKYFYSIPSISKRMLRAGHKRPVQSLILNLGRFLRRKRFETICRMQ
ncbi:MAG: B12-binding domain-containing radical SAM protein [Deltaproteobacteria bacterium]|nr:B12-binding domain-containing radical SAM protein [Deltaproteobacteria bacterium]